MIHSFTCRRSSDIRIPSCPLDSSVHHDDLTRISRSRAHQLFSCHMALVVAAHDPHQFPEWRLEGTLRHHHPSRFDSSLSLSRCHEQATPQSPAVSCAGVQQLDERLREKLCVTVRTLDVDDCHDVILVLSSRLSVTECALHQFGLKSWSSLSEPSICLNSCATHRGRTCGLSA